MRDYAQVKGDGTISKDIAVYALNQLGVDQFGLDLMDRRILSLIYEKYSNGVPVGIDTIAAALSEERDTLEEVCWSLSSFRKVSFRKLSVDV